MERVYGLAPAALAAAIEALLTASVLFVESERDVFTAMIALRDRRGSFVDALIGALARSAGCSSTLTFDRDALPLAGFVHP